MFKKTTYIILLIFLLTSCADGWDSVKRGLTGSKAKSTDEFLIKKKDPLILPPNFENLPTPEDSDNAEDDAISFEEKLSKTDSLEEISSSGSTTEESILRQIRKK